MPDRTKHNSPSSGLQGLDRPDERFMQRALNLARRGQGRVEPNPMVGAVIVREGKIVAEGYHHGFGRAHAEAEALAQCRARWIDPTGLMMYVTLEPCCHHGKTPPCTDAIIQAKLRRVVTAMVDPAPHAAGQGIQRLREAGVEVEVGLCESQARRLNEPFVKRVTTGLPWVIAKWAQTLDGRIATRTGDSQWISNEVSRLHVHRLRSRVDAVIVGIGTVLADDPALTARQMPRPRLARRVVIDPDLQTPLDSQLVRSQRSAEASEPAPPVDLACRESLLDARPAQARALQDAGVRLIGLPPVEGGRGRRLQLEPLLRHLVREHEATNVLVEGGAAVMGSFFAQRLVDELRLFIAPKLLGDAAALSPVTGLDCAAIADATGMNLRNVTRCGEDVMLSYRVASS